METKIVEVLENTAQIQESETTEVGIQDLQSILRILRRTDINSLEELNLLDFEGKLTKSNPNIINFTDTEMSFKEYTDFDKFERKFNANIDSKNLLSQVIAIDASEKLQEELAQGFRLGFKTEKERSERIIAPILHEIADKYHEDFTLHSGKVLKSKDFPSLRGECDFVFARNSVEDFIQAPAHLFVESKSETIQQGVKQVLAQMFGAIYYNREQDTEVKVIWGIVTNGEMWRFLKLEKLSEEDAKDFLITFDKNTFAIAKDYEVNTIRGTEKILGILEYLLKEFQSHK